MSTVVDQTGEASIQIGAPNRFDFLAQVICTGYGLLLVLPAVASMLAVSLVGLSFWTLIIPLVTLGLATFFLPFGFGNGYVRRLARPLRPTEATEAFLVQLTFSPRLRPGLWALFEDADDIGWLYFRGSTLVFSGDFVQLSLPRERLQNLRLETGGLRGLFLYLRIALDPVGAEGIKTMKFAERSTLLLPNSRTAARQMYLFLKNRLETPPRQG
jgi:hypothetical protein